jgi:hypothetical protein
VLRPPPGLLLAYRFLGWRLGPAYRDWVLDDILRPGWLVRQGAPALASVLLLGGVLFAALDADPSKLYALIFIATAGALFLRQSLRERALRQQGIDVSGTRLPDAGWYDDDRARRRKNLIGAVGTVVLAVGGLVVLALRSQT